MRYLILLRTKRGRLTGARPYPQYEPGNQLRCVDAIRPKLAAIHPEPHMDTWSFSTLTDGGRPIRHSCKDCLKKAPSCLDVHDWHNTLRIEL